MERKTQTKFKFNQFKKSAPIRNFQKKSYYTNRNLSKFQNYKDYYQKISKPLSKKDQEWLDGVWEVNPRDFTTTWYSQKDFKIREKERMKAYLDNLGKVQSVVNKPKKKSKKT